MARAWWVVASEGPNQRGWHWRRFLGPPPSRREGMGWGGPGWIESSMSFVRIEAMRKGDRVIAYQAQEGVVGIARLAGSGRRASGSDNWDCFDLAAANAIRFKVPVPLAIVKALPGAADTFEFVRSLRGTVFNVEPGGYERVVALAIAFNPELTSRLARELG